MELNSDMICKHWINFHHVHLDIGTLLNLQTFHIRTFMGILHWTDQNFLDSYYTQLLLNYSGSYLNPQILLRGPQLLGNEQPM